MAPSARGAHRGVDGGVPAHHDDGQVGARGADALEQLDAVAVGQRDVEEADVVRCASRASPRRS